MFAGRPTISVARMLQALPANFGLPSWGVAAMPARPTPSLERDAVAPCSQSAGVYGGLDSPSATPIEWRADVGFVSRWDPPFSVLLGQVGFLDTFTVTSRRMAGTLAIEDPEVFDER